MSNKFLINKKAASKSAYDNAVAQLERSINPITVFNPTSRRSLETSFSQIVDAIKTRKGVLPEFYSLEYSETPRLDVFNQQDQLKPLSSYKVNGINFFDIVNYMLSGNVAGDSGSSIKSTNFPDGRKTKLPFVEEVKKWQEEFNLKSALLGPKVKMIKEDGYFGGETKEALKKLLYYTTEKLKSARPSEYRNLNSLVLQYVNNVIPALNAAKVEPMNVEYDRSAKTTTIPDEVLLAEKAILNQADFSELVQKLNQLTSQYSVSFGGAGSIRETLPAGLKLTEQSSDYVRKYINKIKRSGQVTDDNAKSVLGKYFDLVYKNNKQIVPETSVTANSYTSQMLKLASKINIKY